MPIPSEDDLKKFIAERGPYRLACQDCSREDFDGVKELPTDWGDIGEFQSLKASLSTYDEAGDPDEPPGFCVLDWYTHVGCCPECNSEANEATRRKRSLTKRFDGRAAEFDV